MKILMISADKKIGDEKSDVYERQRAYARMCDELHIIVLTDSGGGDRVRENLFLYAASGNKIMQRMHALRIARLVAKGRKMNVITAQSPDEIGLIAYIIARLFHIRLQLQVHTDVCSPWYRSAGMVPRMKYMLARFLLRRADCVRVVSARIARSLVSELNIPESLITVLPIFTDVALFAKRIEAPKDGRMRKPECSMIAVGRFLDKEKNFSMLIRAMITVVKQCPAAVLTLVGDGPDKEYYEMLVAAFNLKNNVFLKPWRNDLSVLYPSFDLFVLPSYIEGWGMAVIEAMAAGLAVVMTDVGVAGEVVRDGINGIVVPVNDQDALAHALIQLCKNPDLRKKYSQKARETVLHLVPRTKEEYLKQWRKSFDCCSRSIVPSR